MCVGQWCGVWIFGCIVYTQVTMFACTHVFLPVHVCISACVCVYVVMVVVVISDDDCCISSHTADSHTCLNC